MAALLRRSGPAWQLRSDADGTAKPRCGAPKHRHPAGRAGPSRLTQRARGDSLLLGSSTGRNPCTGG